MMIFFHTLSFFFASCIIWIFSGFVIDAVDRVAHRLKQSSFTVAFFVLGFLTSIGEISVMVNSTLNGTPQVSAGNLSGASFVILLGIVPVLAIVGNGIKLQHLLTRWQFGFALAVVALPCLLYIDGTVAWWEGLFCLAGYGGLYYSIRKSQKPVMEEIAVIEKVERQIMEDVDDDRHRKHRASLFDGGVILVGAIAIFLSGHVLVDETMFFAELLQIPPVIIGVLVLAIGTNMPELVIAIRSVKKNHADIAFGDYMGSSMANTLVFGLLPLLNGTFVMVDSTLWLTSLLMVLSFGLLFWFSQTSALLSRKEGWVLLVMYGVFVCVQTATIIHEIAA